MNLVVNTLATAALAAGTLRFGSVRGRSIVAGIFAMAAASLLLVGTYVIFPRISTTPPAGELILWLFFTAFLEELCKYVAVGPWRNGVSGGGLLRHAVGTGVGFATAEHTLFLLLPTGLFVQRILLTSPLHVLTAVLYTRPGPWLRHRTPGVAPAADVAILLLATGVHGLYNFLLQGLDPFTAL